MNEEASLNTQDLVFWVTELQEGRPDAAEPVFRKIVERVQRLAAVAFKKFPRVGRFVDLDDVVQNSLIRLLAAFREVRPQSRRHFYALVNELIRRELLDLTRSYYGPRGHGTNLSDVVVGDGDQEHAPADPVVGGDLDLFDILHEAVGKLPAEEREVIGLTFYHGWDQRKIANLFGVSVRTVGRWHVSAVEKLRQEAAPDA